VITDKSQGSTPKYLTCDGLPYNKFLSFNLLVKEFLELLNVLEMAGCATPNVWQSYGQNGWLFHARHSPYTFILKDAELAR